MPRCKHHTRRERKVWGRAWLPTGTLDDARAHLNWLASESGRRKRDRDARLAWEAIQARRAAR